MYHYFWTECIELYHKNSSRSPKQDYAASIALFAVFLLFYIDAVLFLQQNAIQTIFLLATVLCAILLLGYLFYQERQRGISQHADMADYKAQYMIPLSILLEKYDLLSVSGIDWAIACGKRGKERNLDKAIWDNMKQIYNIIVWPVAALLFGAILGKAGSEQGMDTIAHIMACFLLLALFIYCVYPIAVFILNPDRHKLNRLEEDLNYIKTQLEVKKSAAEPQ